MNTIIVFFDLISRELSNRKHRNNLNKIISIGQVLMALINEMLDIFKVKSKKIKKTKLIRSN